MPLYDGRAFDDNGYPPFRAIGLRLDANVTVFSALTVLLLGRYRARLAKTEEAEWRARRNCGGSSDTGRHRLCDRSTARRYQSHTHPESAMDLSRQVPHGVAGFRQLNARPVLRAACLVARRKPALRIKLVPFSAVSRLAASSSRVDSTSLWRRVQRP